MKHNFEVREINKYVALDMVQKYHYSNTLPKLNKYFLGFYENNDLKGVITLGWGTRPKHTIKKMFPSLDTQDYLEIGRMCMTEEMERNSESQMISACVKWLKRNVPTVKVLFTWADGMLGKPGYVYQASNFMYVGFNQTDIYLKDGIKIHPRQTRALFKRDENDTRLSIRPTVEQQIYYGIEHYRGNQYKYLYFLCGKYAKRYLLKHCEFEIQKPPKKDSLRWQKYNTLTKKWQECDMPPYVSDFDKGSKILQSLVEKFMSRDTLCV